MTSNKSNEMEQMSIFDVFPQDTWCGRTYPEHCPQTTEETSKPYSQKLSESANLTQTMFLYMVGGEDRLGLLQEQYSEYPTESLFPLPTEYMMHSFGEYPNEERESHLWQILTVYPHPKYYLSAKACQGILNRSVKRGKKLPPLLEEVLMKQSASKNEPDVMGGGKGILIQNDRTGALSTVNNQYVLSDTVCIEGNGSRPSHHGDGYIESDKMYTLNTTEQHKVAYVVGGGAKVDVR